MRGTFGDNDAHLYFLGQGNNVTLVQVNHAVNINLVDALSRRRIAIRLGIQYDILSVRGSFLLETKQKLALNLRLGNQSFQCLLVGLENVRDERTRILLELGFRNKFA